nr:3'-5' exonuclease [Methylosinus sp. RM1]
MRERRRSRGEKTPPRAISGRRARRPRLRRGSPVWRYLAEERRLPSDVLARGIAADVVREGPYRCVTNEPRRGFGAKAMEAVESEASFRGVSLLRALDTATLPTKCRAAGLQFAGQLRRIGEDRSHTLAEQISLLLDASFYRAMLRDSKAETSEDRLESLQELISLAGEFHTARELLDHAALATSRAGEDETDRVRLMTLHKAKGLEFPHVFLPAWEAGVFPSDYGDADEERRLAYVALTRGMRRVSISYCGFRRGYGTPSLFIDDIPGASCVRGRLHGPDQRRDAARSTVDRRRLPNHLRRP